MPSPKEFIRMLESRAIPGVDIEPEPEEVMLVYARLPKVLVRKLDLACEYYNTSRTRLISKLLTNILEDYEPEL